MRKGRRGKRHTAQFRVVANVGGAARCTKAGWRTIAVSAGDAQELQMFSVLLGQAEGFGGGRTIDNEGGEQTRAVIPTFGLTLYMQWTRHVHVARSSRRWMRTS